MMLVLEVNVDIFKEKKGSMVKSFCWDICTIGVDIIESYIFNY
jgi:hypothetical protein